MKGLVYKSTGSWYIVKAENGEIYNARIKGALKLDDEITSTNPIAVGDWVEFELEFEHEQTAIISSILPRRNYINRQSPRHKYMQHIVASNIDQSILLATIKEPRTSQGFIDRYIVACEMYHVLPIIVFNKSDLYKAKEMAKFEEWKAMYEAIGYQVYLVSVLENDLGKIREVLDGKCTLISGHSGVGKSSFLNSLLPNLSLRTQVISGWSGKGMHTTTFAEMYDLPNAGKIIDTPGMRELGLIDIEKQELSHYFIEMKPFLPKCQFNNCLHVNEKICGVKDAVNNNLIAIDRYVSYMTILDSLENPER